MTEENLEIQQEVEQEVEQEIEQLNEEPNNGVEEKARQMGWKPQEEYKGDPNRWTDAETFVKIGEERIPVMKENLNKVLAKNAEFEQKIKAMEEFHKESSERQYKRAMEDLLLKQRAAVEDADTDTFDALEKQKEQIKVDYSPKESPPQKPQEIVNWEIRNPWYQNPTLASKAIEVENRIIQEEAFRNSQDPFYTPMSLADRLEEVSNRVKSEFQKEPTRRLPAVEGARPVGGKKPAKTWNDIPTEDRDKANEWVKRGIISQADYVKDYFGE